MINYSKTRDLFSPLNIFALLQALRYVPSFFTNSEECSVDGISDYYYIVFIFQVLSTSAVLYGYYKYKQKKCEYRIINYYGLECHSIKRKRTVFAVGTFACFLGLLFVYVYIRSFGGVAYILANPKDDRYNAGSGYLSSMRYILLFGVLLLLSLKKKRITIFALAMFCIYCLSYFIFTNRSPILEAVLVLMMYRNYSTKRIHIKDFLKPKYVFIILIAFLIIIYLPIIRDNGGFSGDVGSDFKQVGLLFSRFFDQFSYTGRDAFIYQSFNVKNFWYGRTLVNLLSSPIPRTIYSAKPPVDDGLYIYNFMNGFYIVPPSNSFPLYNSIPMSTQGSMYANFGIAGVFLGCYFIGKIYASTYLRLKNTKPDSFLIICYFSIIYQLELSSLSITQTLIPIAFAFVFYKVCLRRTVVGTGIRYSGSLLPRGQQYA